MSTIAWVSGNMWNYCVFFEFVGMKYYNKNNSKLLFHFAILFENDCTLNVDMTRNRLFSQLLTAVPTYEKLFSQRNTFWRICIDEETYFCGRKSNLNCLNDCMHVLSLYTYRYKAKPSNSLFFFRSADLLGSRSQKSTSGHKD